MAITRSKQIRGGVGELDKVLKASGLALKDVQIVPVVGKFGTEFYIYYEDKDLPPENTSGTDENPNQSDDAIDLTHDEPVTLERRNRTINGFEHVFEKKSETKGRGKKFVTDCAMSVRVATDFKTAHLDQGPGLVRGHVPQAVVEFSDIKGFHITGAVKPADLFDSKSRDRASIAVDGYDQIHMLADALETAAVRLRMLIKE